MAVVESMRGEGKFDVLIKANYLALHSIKVCNNEKIFLPEYQNALTNDIIKHSKDIYIKCFEANNVLVRAKSKDYERNKVIRRSLQIEAHDLCNTLLAEIQIAKTLFHIKGSRIEYWGRLILELRYAIDCWRESDRKRFI